MSENEPTAKKATQGLDRATASDQQATEGEPSFQFFRRRTQELQTAGISEGHARGIAMLERRFSQWPLEWGNELRFFIYGDFRPPQADLHFPDLGIVVEAGAVEESIAKAATCVVKARVTVPEKSVAGLVDASARINTLLGVFTALDWGSSGSGCGWWCHVTHGSIGGGVPEFDRDGLTRAIKAVAHLQPDVRRKVISALHWIREPMQMITEGYRSDVLRIYAGYWNAFECLVEAVCVLRPQPKASKKQKQEKIDQFLAARGGKLDPDSLSECYRSFVDRGFVAKASHALAQCFPDRANGYITECFEAKPKEDRLYDIRNAINHGDIEAENLVELIRIEDKQRRLWMIVFGMLGQLIPVPRPVDTGAH